MSEYVKRPVNVSPMNEFLFVISAEHACRNPLANHPMFELHWVDSMSVLQVPQTKSFNKETLLCAFRNTEEVCVNKPKGRHCLKGADCVMFWKKSRQPWVEKFCGTVVSNG